MNKTIKSYILFFILFSLLGCSIKKEPTVVEQAQSLIGLSFKAALNSSYLVSSSFSLLTEPPGIYRFANGKNKYGEEVSLYVSRNRVIQDFKFKTKLSDFYPKEIEGVAIKYKGKWKKFGKGVISYYHIN